jgi:hypothetical protein
VTEVLEFQRDQELWNIMRLPGVTVCVLGRFLDCRCPSSPGVSLLRRNIFVAVVRFALITKAFLMSNRKSPSYLSVLWAEIEQSV